MDASSPTDALSAEGERVLIIEDDEGVRTAYAEALALQGFHVGAAADGKSALEQARRGDWSVIVVDLVLPDRGGIDLIRELKGLDADACVIVMTNYASLESAVEAVRAGAYDYLCKPLDIADLGRAVTRGAEARRLARQNRELLRQLAGANAALEEQKRRLEEKVSTAQREMSALVELGMQLGAETSMPSALAHIVDVASALTQSRGGAVLLHDDERGALVGFLARGAAPLGIDAVVRPASEGLLGSAAAGEAALVNNEVLVSGGDEFLRGLGVRRVLAMPLHAQGALQGLMVLFDKSPAGFTEHDGNTAAVLAQFAASVIAAFRLRDATGQAEAASREFVPIHELLRR